MTTAFGDLVVRFSADVAGLKRGTLAVNRTLGGLHRLALGVGSALGAISGAGLFGSMIRSGEEFDRKMLNSLAIMGQVSDSMKSQMRETALAVASTTMFTPAQSAEGYYHLVSAGMDAKQALAALPQVALFAQAGMFDLGKATELAATAQAAIGLKSDDAQENLRNLTRVTDVLVQANNLAIGTTERFAVALTEKAAASARLVGKTLEETTAVLMAFAMQGTLGEEAGTRLHMVWRDLQSKALKHADAFKKYGIAVYDSNQNMRSTADILEDMERALQGKSDAFEKAALLEMGLTDRSIAGILQLLGLSSKIREFEQELWAAGGKTKEVADKQLTPLQKVMARFGAITADVGSQIKTQLLPPLGNLIGAFGSLLKVHGPAVGGFLKMVFVLGSAATAMWLVNKAIKAYIAFTKGASIATAILQALQGPKGWAVITAGIVAATAATVAVTKQFDALNGELYKIHDVAGDTAAKVGTIGGQSGSISQLAKDVNHLAAALSNLSNAAGIERLQGSLKAFESLGDYTAKASSYIRQYATRVNNVVQAMGGGLRAEIQAAFAGRRWLLTHPFGDTKALQQQYWQLRNALDPLAKQEGVLGDQAREALTKLNALNSAVADFWARATEMRQAPDAIGRLHWRYTALSDAMKEALGAANALQAAMIEMSDDAIQPFGSIENAVEWLGEAEKSLITPKAALDDAIAKINKAFDVGLLDAMPGGADAARRTLISQAMEKFEQAIGVQSGHLKELQDQFRQMKNPISEFRREFERIAELPEFPEQHDLMVLLDQMDKFDAGKKFATEQKRFSDSLKTPAEQLSDRVAEAQRLFAGDPVRQLDALRRLEEEATPKRKQGEYQLPQAALRGSREAASAIAKNWAMMQGRPQRDPNAKTAKNTEDMKKVLGKIKDIMADVQREQKNAEVLGVPG